ncbi:MAG: alpha/beta hydrolase [Betaproteobacteria bacterium]|nr:alpha/beta hydrolase [Betaproteobacteria bacterium]
MQCIRPSSSTFVRIRGLDYHCRIWGAADAPTLFLLHGWMDASASFQFMVDALKPGWRVIAPDWRGFGLTEWGGGDTYWYADYIADLDRILEHFQPDESAILVGHSMGGSIACLYSGIRPERVSKLVNLEGFGMAATNPEGAPAHYAAWLKEIAGDISLRDYADGEAFAARMRADNPRLSAERARYLARHLGKTEGGRVRPCADPVQRRKHAIPYKVEEACACWERITAPVLWVIAAESKTLATMGISTDELERRKACFRQLTLHTVQESGHMLHLDQPERVAQLIEEFLSAD